MNVRIFAAVVFAVLILSVIELACVSNDGPTLSSDYPSATIPSTGLYTDTPEPELPAGPDPRAQYEPVLTP